MKRVIFQDRYELLDQIGEGGMAIVYYAYDLNTQQKVALKVMKDEHVSDSIALARFDREIKTLVSLKHPNILKVYDYGYYKQKPYLVTEYIQTRQSIKELLAKRLILTQMDALDLMIQLTGALEHAHEHKIVHRDIKPSNIMVLEDNTIKLADFGIATFENASKLTLEGKVVGSVHYMAPELFDDDNTNISYSADIYACGITLFEMLTGKVPFNSSNFANIVTQHLHANVPNVHTLDPQIDIRFDAIIAKATAKSPLKRYASITELKNDCLLLKQNFEKSPKKGFFSKLFHKE